MSREPFDIGHCWDERSINEKISRLEAMRDYGNDLSQEATKLIDVLEERKRNLHKQD